MKKKKAEGKNKCIKEIIISDSDEVDESDDESIEFQSIVYATKHRRNLFCAYNQVEVNGLHFTHLNPTASAVSLDQVCETGQFSTTNLLK